MPKHRSNTVQLTAGEVIAEASYQWAMQYIEDYFACVMDDHRREESHYYRVRDALLEAGYPPDSYQRALYPLMMRMDPVSLSEVYRWIKRLLTVFDPHPPIAVHWDGWAKS